MKNLKTILQTFLFLAIVLIAAKTDAFAKKPFVIRLVEKPAVLRVGQTHTFVFDVQNVSGAPLTLSSQCAASAGLTWLNKDGTGGGTGSGCASSTIAISTAYDPTTGKFNCISEILPYSRSDFFTLRPNETKRFEAEATVPDDIEAKFVTVTVDYESKYDGSAVGIRASTGEAKSITLKMRVVK